MTNKLIVIEPFDFKISILTLGLFSVENKFCSRSIDLILQSVFHNGKAHNLLAYKSKNSNFKRSVRMFGNDDN